MPQLIEETIQVRNGATVNVMSTKYHTGHSARVDRIDWSKFEGPRVRVFSGVHRVRSGRMVAGFRADVGQDYRMTVATAHKRCDLTLWLIQHSGLDASEIEFI